MKRKMKKDEMYITCILFWIIISLFIYFLKMEISVYTSIKEYKAINEITKE